MKVVESACRNMHANMCVSLLKYMYLPNYLYDSIILAFKTLQWLCITFRINLCRTHHAAEEILLFFQVTFAALFSFFSGYIKCFGVL